MKKLASKKDPTKIMLLASTDEDVDILQTLWNYKVVFGNYSMIDCREPSKIDAEYKAILAAYPDTKMISRINLVAGFAEGVK